MKGEKEVSGTVEKAQFVNPHGSLTLSVKNQNGSSTEWVMTLGSAIALAQRGWVRSDRMPSTPGTALP